MRIGIDISQIVYQGTGVANYTRNLVEHLLKIDQRNQYVLFGSSLRKRGLLSNYLAKWLDKYPNVEGKLFSLPPTFWELVWNRLHLWSVERLIGPVDVFLSSDWIQPPTQKAKKVTTVHDLTPFLFPETMDARIVATHQQRMKWVTKECDLILADSRATAKDLVKLMGIPEEKIKVVYLGNTS